VGQGHDHDDLALEHASILQKIDPRIKLVFVLAALAIDIITQKVMIPAGVFVLCLLALMSTGTNLKYVGKRMLPALGIAFLILITQIFFYGSTPLFAIPIFQHQLVGYVEGLKHGLLLMMRVLAGIGLILFLTVTTTAPSSVVKISIDF